MQSNDKPGNVIDSFWNLLKSMKFAIILLIVLTIASLFNLFLNEFIIPVDGDSELIYKTYASRYGALKASLLMTFQMYKPYHSWWYTGILAILTLSMLICVIDRAPSMFRRSFRPTFIRKPETYTASENHYTLVGESGFIDLATTFLKKKGYLVAFDKSEPGEYLSARKNTFAHIGPWILHVGMIVLIVGGAMVARSEYREYVRGLPGDFLMQSEDEWGFNVRVDDFIINYHPLNVKQTVSIGSDSLGRIINVNDDGTFELELYGYFEGGSYIPQAGVLNSVEAERISNSFDFRMSSGRLDQSNIADYIAVLTVFEGNREIFTKRIEVNVPLRYKGYRFYQSSFNDTVRDDNGTWMTIIEVRKDRGSVLVAIGLILSTIGVFLGLYLVPKRLNIMVFQESGKEKVLLVGKTTRNKTSFENHLENIVKSLSDNSGYKVINDEK